MDPPNILLVIWDSVRAKNCGLYGHDNDTTPRLEQFANRATVFEQARASGIHSIASHASIFSGYHVAEHRLTAYDAQLDPTATAWNDLAMSGYTTGLFTSNVIISETSNLAEPFDHVTGPNPRLYDDGLAPADLSGDVRPLQYLRRAIAHERPFRSIMNGVASRLHRKRHHSEPYIDAFLDWIDQHKEPWAACINVMDAHTPYLPYEEHDRWGGPSLRMIQDELDGTGLREFLNGRPWGLLRALEPLYDGGIRQADAHFGRLLDGLRAVGAYDDSMIIVTSDHGEGFGERSRLTPAVRQVQHGVGIGEELTHVPLVVKDPHQTSGESVSAPSTLTNFREVVKGVSDEDAAPSSRFVPSDLIVLSSTFLRENPQEEFGLSDSAAESHRGPWRARYSVADGHIRKDATRGDDALALAVFSAQDAHPLPDSDPDRVAECFDGLQEANVGLDREDSDDIPRDVRKRLAELGYIT